MREINKNPAVVAEGITKKCHALADDIEKKREEIISLLLKYESFETASDEIFRSLDCLRHIEIEIEHLSFGKVGSMCTFFPVNLPLYSLIIFAIVPSFMADKVFVRPPVLMNDVVQAICTLLDIKKIRPGLEFIDMERSMFREAYVSIADVVLFTGRYHNAKDVQEACPDALFIYNGAGINPVVVTDSADLNLAVHKTIEMRAFNSGQDCAGSDAILVHQKIAKDFAKQLLTDLKHIPVGEYSNRENKVGPLVKRDQLEVVENFFKKHKEQLLYGGEIDYKTGIVYPTVFFERLKNINEISYTEFFAPVFYLLQYEDDAELKRYFSQEQYLDHAMYVSWFGETGFSKEIKNSIILQNKIVNDVERGNFGYGGYGKKANFVSYHGKYHFRPMLISYEIHQYLKDETI